MVGHVAGAAELELLERSEVEIAGVGIGAFGRVHALDAGRALLAEAVGDESGLRAGVRTTDVVSRHLESGRLRHRRPDVSRIGNLGQQFLVKLVPTCVVDVSTTGDSPVTVTVSCSVAT